MRILAAFALTACSSGEPDEPEPLVFDDDDDTPPDCLADPTGLGASPVPATEPATATCTSAGFDGVTIERVDITCDGMVFRVLVETARWTANGRLVVVTDYDETEVDLLSYEFSACGYWDRLASEDEATGCDGTLGCATFVIGVDDLQGDPADCVIVGPETDSLLGGTRALSSSAIDLAGCHAL